MAMGWQNPGSSLSYATPSFSFSCGYYYSCYWKVFALFFLLSYCHGITFINILSSIVTIITVPTMIIIVIVISSHYHSYRCYCFSHYYSNYYYYDPPD